MTRNIGLFVKYEDANSNANNDHYRLTVALALDVKNVDFYYYKTKS